MTPTQFKAEQQKKVKEVLKRHADQAFSGYAQEVVPLISTSSRLQAHYLPVPSPQVEALWELRPNTIASRLGQKPIARIDELNELDNLDDIWTEEDEEEMDEELLKQVLQESGAFKLPGSPPSPTSSSPSRIRISPRLDPAARAFNPGAMAFTPAPPFPQMTAVAPYHPYAPPPPAVPTHQRDQQRQLNQPQPPAAAPPHNHQHFPSLPPPNAPSAPRAMRQQPQLFDKRFSRSRLWATKKLARMGESAGDNDGK